MSGNKRRFPRHPLAESLSMTVVSAAHLVEQGERLYCESVDVSPAGMQVIVDRFIEKECRVEIWFVVLEDRRTYHLKGKVTWVEARSEEGRERFHAGIKLLPADDSDFLHWLALFE
ncbi:MAG: PilZ domain-containing protein [Gammaproteobacteria bacterium]